MTITTITRANLSTIQADILTALAGVEAKHGIKFSSGRGHYGGPTGDTVLKFAVVTASGAVAMSSICEGEIIRHGLTKELVIWPGQHGHWKIVDYNSAAWKMPWIVQREGDNKRYKIGQATVDRYFAQVNRIPASPPVVSAREASIADMAAQAAGQSKPRFDTSHLYEGAEF